jgi:cysteine desulfurase
MTDATQAFGKILLNINELGIDLLSMSAHKIYGPKGTGALYVRSRRPKKVKLQPILHGGGHERELRSGTLNVPGIVGFGKAVEISKKEMKNEIKQIKALRDHLEASLLEIMDTFINGNLEERLYNTSNICFKGADSDAIITGLEDIMISNGSACTSTKIEPSHVLTAMGLNSRDAYSSIRFSLGRFNTFEDIGRAHLKIKEIVNKLRTMNIN